MKPTTPSVLFTVDTSPLFRSAYWALQRAHSALERSDAIRGNKDARAPTLWMEICEMRRLQAREELLPEVAR
jgi:hypothetical protein